MIALVVALMVWASAYTGLPLPSTVPNILFEDACEIQRIYADDPDLECAGEDQFRVVATYNMVTKTMYLPDTWSPADLIHVSNLLHELVHHLQAEAGILPTEVECVGRDIEWPAYKTQIAFLEATGLSGPAVVDAMGLNDLTLVLLTSCMPGS